MNIQIEARNANLRLPSPPTSPFSSPIASTAMAELRARFSNFTQSLDLAPIKYKLIKEKAWTPDRANSVEPQYKAFLFLIGSKVKAEFVPTFDIDEMWHMHILDTRKYMMDCAWHFGEYIHHYPYLGMKDETDRSRAENLFATTCDTISEAFSINVHELDASSCGGGGCGGHGCGGHGCGGGHSSCGSHANCGSHGPGHEDHGSDNNDNTYYGCSSSGGGDAERKRRNPAVPALPGDPSEETEKKPGIWRRIFGLSPVGERTEWYASVTPEFFNPHEFRPDASALRQFPRE